MTFTLLVVEDDMQETYQALSYLVPKSESVNRDLLPARPLITAGVVNYRRAQQPGEL